MLRAVIYCRCSTEEENQKQALLRQVQEAEACVRAQGWQLTDSYIESRSGTSTKGRSEYNRLFGDLKQDRFDVIVIKSQDRLMRNTRDWYLFADRLTTEGKKLYLYIENKFYTPEDALITGIRAILAEDYSRELSKKSNNAHHQRQSGNGTVLLTSNTYGYRKMPDKSVEIIEEEAEIKRRMYELCAAGYGSRSIAALLEKEGVRNRRGNPFSDTDICRMIRSPLNKGTIVMNRRHYDFDTKKTRKVPPEEQFVYENKIPAIVSPELWQKANSQIDARAWGRKKACPCTPGKYGLSGCLVCGLCGSVYYRTVRRKYGEKGRVCEWKCSTYLKAGRSSPKNPRQSMKKPPKETAQGCNNIHLEEEKLLGLLEKALSPQMQMDKEHLRSHMTDLLGKVLAEQDTAGELEKEKKKADQLKRQMSLLLDKLLESVISDTDYKEKLKELEQRLKKTQETVQSLENQGQKTARLEEIKEFLSRKEVLQKAFLAGLLDEVETICVFPEHMEIHLQESRQIKPDGSKEQRKQADRVLRAEYGSAFDYLKKKKEEREQLVSMIRENPCITARQIAEKLGLSLSGANYRLHVLKKEGRVFFRGAGGRGHWEIREKE